MSCRLAGPNALKEGPPKRTGNNYIINGGGSVVDVLQVVLFLQDPTLNLATRIFIPLRPTPTHLYPLPTHYWPLFYSSIPPTAPLATLEFLSQLSDDRLDRPVFYRHLLVVGVALGGGAGFNILTEFKVGLLLLALDGSLGKQRSLLNEEPEIGSILAIAPVVVGGFGTTGLLVVRSCMQENLLFLSFRRS
jgi:hypothetical protein